MSAFQMGDRVRVLPGSATWGYTQHVGRLGTISPPTASNQYPNNQLHFVRLDSGELVLLFEREIGLFRGSPEGDHVPEYVTKDSGSREAFTTGSLRDTREGKGRYDLVPPRAMRRVAQLYERGASKYEAYNWAKGQPLSRLLDSAERHLYAVKEGRTDEDHTAAVIWNMMTFLVTQEWVNEGRLPSELDDLFHEPDADIGATSATTD